MKYQHLSSEERYYIEVELKRGKSFSQMGNSFDRSPSTISREVKRNTGMKGYRYKQARRLTIARIVTLDERKTKLRLAAPLDGKRANLVLDSITALLMPLQNFVKTMTFDNGKEFSKHESIAANLGCDTYFAAPYHSWERGQNENANGLLRQYFPKSIELVGILTKDVFDAVDKLNSRPRKCLGFKTPYEAFLEATGLDVRKIMSHALMT